MTEEKKIDIDELMYRILRDKGLNEFEARQFIRSNQLYHEKAELLSTIAALKEELKKVREALNAVLGSAAPRKHEHPAMYEAWQKGYKALASRLLAKPAKESNNKESNETK